MLVISYLRPDRLKIKRLGKCRLLLAKSNSSFVSVNRVSLQQWTQTTNVLLFSMPPMAVPSCCKAKPLFLFSVVFFFFPKAKIIAIWTFHESFPIFQHVLQNTWVVMIGGNVSQKETNGGGDTGIHGHRISKAEESGKPRQRPPCAYEGNEESVKSWYYCRPCGAT